MSSPEIYVYVLSGVSLRSPPRRELLSRFTFHFCFSSFVRQVKCLRTISMLQHIEAHML